MRIFDNKRTDRSYSTHCASCGGLDHFVTFTASYLLDDDTCFVYVGRDFRQPTSFIERIKWSIQILFGKKVNNFVDEVGLNKDDLIGIRSFCDDVLKEVS